LFGHTRTPCGTRPRAYVGGMSLEQIIGLALALLVMLVGWAGSVLPGLPGTPLVLVAAIGHRLWFGEQGPGNLVLVALLLLTALSLAFDYLATLLGARKLGATWRGVTGAMIGAVVGLFFGPPGILAGPFLGAVLLELAGGREFAEAARAGAGATLGFLLGTAGKAACCVAMIGLFVLSVALRS
jgi:uncharacterized protein